MRAVLFKKTGSVEGLVLSDVPKPVPGPGESLVRVRVATVTRGDIVLRKMPALLARLFGQPRKTILGHEFAGEVEAFGGDSDTLRAGDRVFGTTTGLTTGSYAEYVCVPVNGTVATVPANVTLEEAAAVPVGALTALQFLRRGGVGRGKRLLVIGASGSVGSYAVQLAASFGAHVTGVSSKANLELVRSLGAAAAIDYTTQDFTAMGETYDVIFDAVGKGSSNRNKQVLVQGGSYVSVRSPTKESRADLLFLRGLLEENSLRAVIDRRYTLDQIREAHGYVEQGHKRGNVLVIV